MAWWNEIPEPSVDPPERERKWTSQRFRVDEPEYDRAERELARGGMERKENDERASESKGPGADGA